MHREGPGALASASAFFSFADLAALGGASLHLPVLPQRAPRAASAFWGVGGLEGFSSAVWDGQFCEMIETEPLRHLLRASIAGPYRRVVIVLF